MSDVLRVRVDMVIDGDGRAKFERYTCPSCRGLLNSAVQPSCGHWMCLDCADELFKSAAKNGGSLNCLRDDCGEQLEMIDGANYFPDHFVRKDICKMVIACVNCNRGCQWTGKYSELKTHIEGCQYSKFQCGLCGELLANGEEKAHQKVCPKAMRKCPLARLGCSKTDEMSKGDLQKHVVENILEHLDAIAAVVQEQSTVRLAAPLSQLLKNSHKDEGYHSGDFVEKDGPKAVAAPMPALPSNLLPSIVVADEPAAVRCGQQAHARESQALQQQAIQKIVAEKLDDLRKEMTQMMRSELTSQSEEISSVRSSCAKVERSVRSKNTELEDNNFRLSLLENCNHDGTMIWKIPQISQRMSDAQNGKYTSIFSLPFYTGRYGYKMCMRLYILGDGIGKGSHMSLFFVLMKGEFDNILQWPFTHKVTFKLINQAGGRDVVDTFQPDPMSSSFRKPRSDMNIASGCPQFVSLHDLKNNGFIVDDSIFVKCTVDRNTIHHP